MLQIEFDPTKNDANQRKHGLALSEASALRWDQAVILPDSRIEYGEPRFRAYAMLEGRLHMAAFTLRGAVIRVISLRRANKRERNRYGQAELT